MIDRTRRLLFLHVPKTGGSSIESLLLDSDEVGDHKQLDAEVLSRHQLAPYFPLSRHAALGDYEQFLDREGESIQDYKVFVLVRHPENMLRSTYRFRRSNFELRRAATSRSRRWLFAVQHRTFTGFLATQSLRVAIGKRKLRTLSTMTRSDSGAHVECFRLEDLVKDLSPLLDYLGVVAHGQLPQRNATAASNVPAESPILPIAARIIFPDIQALYDSGEV